MGESRRLLTLHVTEAAVGGWILFGEKRIKVLDIVGWGLGDTSQCRRVPSASPGSV